MRLSEIIKTKFVEPKKGKEFEPLEKDPPESLGHGYSARVMPDPKDPNLVLRQELDFMLPQDNGYLSLVKVMAKESETNPYLPRVYEVTGEISLINKRLHRYTYRIERLHPGYELRPEDIMYLGKKTIKGFEEEVKQEWPRYETKPPPEFSSELWAFLVRLIEKYMQEKKYDKFFSNKIVTAYQLILKAQDIIRQYRSEYTDMSPENVMVRLHRLQIVFSDATLHNF